MADEEWWRVQAFWNVGGQANHYRPNFRLGRPAADELAAEIRLTLSHFSDLSVIVVPATPPEAEREEADRAARQGELQTQVHLMLERDGMTTACGRVGTWIRPDLWELSDAPKCPDCEQRFTDRV
jgi:hypothetical protein